MARTVSIDPVADLRVRLARESTDQARGFWTRYLKGAGTFHGVPMAGVKTCVRAWWSDHAARATTTTARRELRQSRRARAIAPKHESRQRWSETHR